VTRHGPCGVVPAPEPSDARCGRSSNAGRAGARSARCGPGPARAGSGSA